MQHILNSLGDERKTAMDAIMALCGVTKVTLYNWMKAPEKVPYHHLVTIACILGTTTENLIHETK